MNSHPFRSLWLDPDFTRNPKTSLFCCVCQRDIKGDARFFARVVDGGFFAVHPEDEGLVPDDYPEDFGTLPVGPECARRIGREWLKESSSA